MSMTVTLASVVGRRFIALQRWILIVASSFLVLVVFTEVVLRYVFEHPIFGTDELASMIAVWVYFIGAAHASYTRTHIEGGFLASIFKKSSVVDTIRLVVLVFTLIVCFIFIFMAYEWCLWTVQNNVTTTSLFFPKIWGEVAMLIGAILMSVYFAIETIEIVHKLRQGSRAGA